jgi:hypothetical protein
MSPLFPLLPKNQQLEVFIFIENETPESRMEAGLLWFCNWSTLGMCAALKLPQIYAQLAVRSVQGIGLPSLLLELVGFLVFLHYQHYYGNPLLTYLEYPILIAQDSVLLHFVFHFNGNVKQALPYMAVFVSSWFILRL